MNHLSLEALRERELHLPAALLSAEERELQTTGWMDGRRNAASETPFYNQHRESAYLAMRFLQYYRSLDTNAPIAYDLDAPTNALVAMRARVELIVEDMTTERLRELLYHDWPYRRVYIRSFADLANAPDSQYHASFYCFDEFDDESCWHRWDYPADVIETWDLSRVANLCGLFCQYLNDPPAFSLHRWDMSGVHDVAYMFAGYKGPFPCNTWRLTSVTTADAMMLGAVFTTPVDVSSWGMNQLVSAKELFAETNVRFVLNRGHAISGLNAWHVDHLQHAKHLFRNTAIDATLATWTIPETADTHEMCAGTHFYQRVADTIPRNAFLLNTITPTDPYWTADEQYQANDVVVHRGCTFVALCANRGIAPNADRDIWLRNLVLLPIRHFP